MFTTVPLPPPIACRPPPDVEGGDAVATNLAANKNIDVDLLSYGKTYQSLYNP